jgi:alkanesulfonate monooxygenase SsuD/methylene tetrahydromethanopterin reductase-like flavin-dependent oxidoreductase (luciferase family)
MSSSVESDASKSFDFVAKGDHLGGPAPFTLLAAVAGVTERLRVRTYVLNVGFLVSANVAREAATLDLLSDGRLELGLGAGTVGSEFASAGLVWRPLRNRIEQMEHTLLDVRRRLADPTHVPRPVQNPIPILVGAMSRDDLAVAADHADIVGYSALRHTGEGLRAMRAEETDQLVALVRRRAKGRRFESDVLLQLVELGRDPLRAAKAAVERELEGDDPYVLAGSPCVLFAPDRCRSRARDRAAT